MTDSRIANFTTEGWGLFQVVSGTVLHLENEFADWMAEVVGCEWNVDKSVLTFEKQSLVGQFLVQLKKWQQSDFNLVEDRLIVRDDTILEVKGFEVGRNLWLAIRRVDDYEESEGDLNLEALSRLTGGVARDFNHLIGDISGNLSELLDHSVVREVDEAVAKLSNVDEAVGKASSLVKQLMTYAGRSQLNKASVETNKLLTEAITRFSNRSQFAAIVNSEIPEDIWSVDADESYIYQVLSIILKNAGRAIAADGSIHLTARNFVLAEQSLSNAFDCEPGEYVIITIADDGCGMSREIREMVFEPFFTTNPSGSASGLGLANAQAIVKQHGGHISCTSVEGQGTAFSLYLPRYQIEAEANPVRESTPEPTSRNREPGVLVVEDEDLLRNLVRTLCEKNGYRTFGAADGLEALEFINENADEIFVAVIDLAMPRMTGNELFRELNAKGSDLPVIVASGFLVDPDKFIEETGGEPYAIFSKPYQLSELITKINELRDKQGVVMAS